MPSGLVVAELITGVLTVRHCQEGVTAVNGEHDDDWRVQKEGGKEGGEEGRSWGMVAVAKTH